MKSIIRIVNVIFFMLFSFSSTAETKKFLEISKRDNMLQYATGANGEKFFLDWELLDRSSAMLKYTRAINSSSRELGDLNFNCELGEVSYQPNRWITPPTGSVFHIMLTKVCGKKVKEHLFVFGGVFSGSDFYVSVGNVRYVQDMPNLFEIVLISSQPVGGLLPDAWWGAPNYESVRVDCKNYIGLISKPHSLDAQPDFSQSSFLQLDKTLPLFTRICDEQQKFLGYIFAAVESNNSSRVDSGATQDFSSLIQRCIASGRQPGTPEFTGCLKVGP